MRQRVRELMQPPVMTHGYALIQHAAVADASSFMSISTPMAAGSDDEATLLAFKAAAISSGYDDPLASWNGSTGGYCSWEGVRCRGRDQRVVALSLSSRGLTGVLSPAIGNLSSLRTLNLSFNGFRGDIPASLGRLRHLQVLDLRRNIFSGEFPVKANLHYATPKDFKAKQLVVRVLSC